MTEKPNGLIQIYTGNGKGKTTAALGLALRATGQGLKVIIIQFIKGIQTGEHIFAAKYNSFEIVQPAPGDCYSKTQELLAEEAKKTFEFARQKLLSRDYNVVILDEVFIAVSQNYISAKDVLKLMEQKPDEVELVMTGRNAPPEIVRRADLVTEMLMIKHPFEMGVKGRKGIEF
jgi:cob(I)alamin adenosyltransferase